MGKIEINKSDDDLIDFNVTYNKNKIRYIGNFSEKVQKLLFMKELKN
nr:hypothetical protein [Entomoplasma sp. MP1]